MAESVSLVTLKCAHCGYKWHPRTSQAPKLCPNCKFRTWKSEESKELTEATLAWMAGILDGKGHIGIRKVEKENRKHPNYYLDVWIGVVAKNQPLSMFVEWFGGSISEPWKRYETSPPQIRWSITNDRALKFLEAIYPYLVWKKEKALLGMEFQRTKREPLFKSVLTQQEIDYREETFQKMRLLNRRGDNGYIESCELKEASDVKVEAKPDEIED